MLHINGIAHWLNAFVRVDVSVHQPHQRVPRKSVRTRELPQDRYDRLARQQPPRIEYEAQCRGQPSFIEAEYREARAISTGASLRVDKHATGCMARLNIAGVPHSVGP